MRLFNVLIAPEGENPIKDKFNKNEFTFVKDSVKINNKYIGDTLINQRLRIDKFIDTDAVTPITNVGSEEHTLYRYKTYDVVSGVDTDIVLNDKTLNPLLLKTKNPNNYGLAYITFDPKYMLVDYSVESYDKIISTFHRKDFYGCVVYFDKEKHANDVSSILSITAIDTTKTKKPVVNIEVTIDPDSDSSIVVSYYIRPDSDVENKSHKQKPNRFKLKLNPHKIPTAFVIVDGYDDNELGDVTASARLDEICISKQVVYVELGDHKIDDPEFIQYLQDIINESHYKSVTLADVYMPNAIIKKLGLINVFTYDSAKKICKCIRSS